MKKIVKKRQQRIAFQGERGAFSEEAILRLLGPDVEVVPCPWFDAVFKSLASGEVDAAVIPIENTLHGSVHENYDHLLQFDMRIIGETSVRIVHNLLAPAGVSLRKIRRIYSHPVALNQCLKFFADHPEMERVPFYDTAGSIKMVMEERPEGAAAIASARAATIYGARVLKRSIEDDQQNFTRFFLLRRHDEEPLVAEAKRGWKTSLVFTTSRNQAGSLFRSLSAFALRDLSLTKIESRPLRGKPWEYLFYLDFLGKISDEKCQKALGHLGELADFLRVLGSYPRAD
ncbi:MAG: prephenate dehydratase [Bryobacteraceae bacterium]